jgi:Ca2+-binding RTX toxin-like protein
MSGVIRKGMLFAGALLALAAGASTAIVVAEGPTGPITLEGNIQKRLTIRGSDRAEAITISGSAAGAVTLHSMNNNFENMRTDCETLGPASTDAVCTSDVSTIDAQLREGGDTLRFGAFKANGVTVNAGAARGADKLVGSSARDHFAGGGGRDSLRGKGNADHLDGGPGRDHCNGGRGRDEISHCE